MAMTSFERNQINAFMDDMRKAFDEVAEKHGVQIDNGTYRVNDEYATCSLKIHLLDDGVPKEVVNEIKEMGLPASYMGGKRKVVGLKPRAAKPFIVLHEDGQHYKYDEEALRHHAARNP